MADIQLCETPATSETPDEKKRIPAYKVFRSIVQADFPRQMEVLNWLTSDTMYECIYIAHNHDIYDMEDEEDRKKFVNGIYTRKNGDGSESQFRFGDTKPLHYHLVTICPKKIAEKTMMGRFGNYVIFQGVHDIFENIRYLTHETFRARNKWRYQRCEVQGNLETYQHYIAESQDEISFMKKWNDYMSAARQKCCLFCNRSGTSECRAWCDIQQSLAPKIAIQAVVDDGDLPLLRSIYAHSYLYKSFF